MSSDEKSDRDLEITWLDDHGPYEVCMMRYGLLRMHQTAEQLAADPNQRAQLEYNAYFECFAGKARLLVDFFTGRRSHRTNFKATDFFPDYSAPKRDHVQDTINLIDPQVSHPGKKRAVEAVGKIKLSDCKGLAKWIEKALAKFLDGMPQENRKHWNDHKAECVANSTQMDVAAPPGASSVPTFGSSSPTFSFLGRTDPSSK